MFGYFSQFRNRTRVIRTLLRLKTFRDFRMIAGAEMIQENFHGKERRG